MRWCSAEPTEDDSTTTSIIWWVRIGASWIQDSAFGHREKAFEWKRGFVTHPNDREFQLEGLKPAKMQSEKGQLWSPLFSIVYLSSGGYLLQSKRNWNGLEMPTDERRLGEQVGEPAGPAQLHGDVGFEKYLPRKNENRSTPLERKKDRHLLDIKKEPAWKSSISQVSGGKGNAGFIDEEWKPEEKRIATPLRVTLRSLVASGHKWVTASEQINELSFFL